MLTGVGRKNNDSTKDLEFALAQIDEDIELDCYSIYIGEDGLAHFYGKDE